MATNKINPTSNTQNSGKKNKAARAGAAIVAGGAAAAGVAYATGAFGAEETDLPEGEILEETQEGGEPVAGGETAAQPGSSSSGGHTEGNTNNSIGGHTGSGTTGSGGSNGQSNPSGGQSNGNAGGSNGQNQNNGNQEQPTHEEEVNPDEIADAIIAEEQIDPNDINMDDVFNFTDIGTVYTVEGESYTAATFHDQEGNEMSLVDIDGNGYFDLVLDENLVAVAEIDEVVSISDAEVAINHDPTYLAANTGEEPSLPTGEDIMNDLIQA